ncbi:MAG TPA: hypothetical protein VGL81_29045 [Polyangiaceae bacterium]|jgi:hypothetical protein
MPPPGKKRPIKSGRHASRDPRIDSAPPAAEEAQVQVTSRPPASRIAALEGELERVNKERAADADDLATMLVRIADAERGKAAATLLAQELGDRVLALEAQVSELRDVPPRTEPDPKARELAGELDAARLRLGELMGVEARLRTRADELEERLTEAQAMTSALGVRVVEGEARLQAALGDVQEAEQAVQMATGRAVLAERSADDGAATVERIQAELSADRARVVDLETKLARVKREHSDAMEAASRELATALEGAARQRAEQAAGAEAKLAEALRTLERESADAAAATRAESAHMVAVLREEHASAIEQNRREHAAELDAMGMSQAAELAALAKTHAEALKSLEERHAHTTSAMREEQAASRRSAARALEEERSASARAKLQVLALEGSVTSMRATAARAIELLDELGCREQAAAAARAGALEQAKRTLAGDGVEKARPVAEPAREAGSLDEIEIDLD